MPFARILNNTIQQTEDSNDYYVDESISGNDSYEDEFENTSIYCGDFQIRDEKFVHDFILIDSIDIQENEILIYAKNHASDGVDKISGLPISLQLWFQFKNKQSQFTFMSKYLLCKTKKSSNLLCDDTNMRSILQLCSIEVIIEYISLKIFKFSENQIQIPGLRLSMQKKIHLFSDKFITDKFKDHIIDLFLRLRDKILKTYSYDKKITGETDRYIILQQFYQTLKKTIREYNQNQWESLSNVEILILLKLISTSLD
ncbi:hypothetical protein AB837_00575 [bacterium AB1]|nr:hypothetical protein AB837_00575 [bacterium AB1]